MGGLGRGDGRLGYVRSEAQGRGVNVGRGKGGEGESKVVG